MPSQTWTGGCACSIQSFRRNCGVKDRSAQWRLRLPRDFAQLGYATVVPKAIGEPCGLEAQEAHPDTAASKADWWWWVLVSRCRWLDTATDGQDLAW